ncbi:MAG: protein kinase [Actinomycetota bacterium]|nr:protein kinase [Actinomycetota bacterium]
MINNNFEKNKLISNRYKIIKKIASGGMADVFLGEDLKLGRKVAIKILSSNYSNDRSFVARFKSEAEILAKLDHPNIVRVYDWGKHNSSYYICMEYIEGENLKEIIEKRSPLPPEITANYAIQISNALLAAHKNNLIHRDIKPQNILVTPEGKVKVTDFGIAKSLVPDVTRTLNIMGTAHYISPEQAKGEVLDHRTDIYSLGIVMYEMLTGDVPFRGGTSIDISLKHISEKPLKPSELVENIPPKLEKIVMHCLEKDPAARYSDLSELISDLQKYKTSRPLSFSGTSAKNRGKRRMFMKKIKSAPAVIATAIFMLLFMVLSITYACKYYNYKNFVSSIVSVPYIVNIPIENADKILSPSGLKLKVINETCDPEIPEGFIISQNPEPGEKIPVGSEIGVTVSKGPEITLILTPNLIGLNLEDARVLLEEYGLTTGDIKEKFSDTFRENIVIDQSPKFNENIKPGESVNLIVSKGEEIIVIPDVINQDFITGLNQLQSLGLIVKSSRIPIVEENNINEPGKIVAIIPSPGSKVRANSLVKLMIATNEPLIEIPDFTSQSISTAISVIDSMDLKYEISYIKADYSVQKDLVIGQDPEAYTYISPDSTIILFVGS